MLLLIICVVGFVRRPVEHLREAQGLRPERGRAQFREAEHGDLSKDHPLLQAGHL